MSVPTTFKAAVVPTAGGQNTVVDRQPRELQPHEVLVKVHSAAINPIDWKGRDYRMYYTDYPAVFGSDAAGSIVAAGPDVRGFHPGDRVFLQGILTNNDSATFQQYTVLDAKLVGRTPSNLTDDEAAGVSLATVTAVAGLYEPNKGYGLPPPWAPQGDHAAKGRALVVLGGASSVGQYVIQLARLSGFDTIVTTSSASHHAHLRQLGATHTLDRTAASVPDFLAAVGSARLDLVYDAITAVETQKLAVDILAAKKEGHGRPGGEVILVLPPDETQLARGKQAGVALKPIAAFGSSPELRPLTEPLFRHLGGDDGYLARRLFVPNRVEVVPGGLEAVEEALRRNKEGVSGVKLVIRPFETKA